MSGKCGKCAIDFSSGENSVKCSECVMFFHVTCTRLGSVQNLTKAKLKTWKCDMCRGETVSVKSNEDITPSDENKSILDALHAMRMDINTNIDNKVGELKSSIDTLSSQFIKLNDKLTSLETNQNALRGRVDKLENGQEDARDDIRGLRIKLQDVEQHSRAANMEIVGIPSTHGENVYAILDKIARVIAVEYKREDISVAHRLRIFAGKHVHPPIVVQFVSRSIKEEWMLASKKRRGFDAVDLAPTLPRSAVYLNDHLTSHNKMLLGRARRMLKQKKLHYAAFNNGKVLIKPTDKDQSIRVFELQDLDRYDN